MWVKKIKLDASNRKLVVKEGETFDNDLICIICQELAIDPVECSKC